MKYIFLLSLITLFSFDINDNKSNPYINYSLNISQAESLILKENYSEALRFYKKAFSINIKPIAKNCFTAMQVAAIENDIKFFKKTLKKGFERGLIPEYLSNDSLIGSYISKNKLEKFINSEFEISNKKYKKSINYKLLDTINKLSNLDNKWKIYYLDSLSTYDSKNKDIYWKKYDSIISDIVDVKLISLITKYGFPEERNIDLNYLGIKSLSNKPNYNYSFGNNKAKLILLHYYSYPRDRSYNQLLKNEVFKGNLQPEIYASIMDFQSKFSYIDEYYNEWHQTEDTNKFEAINKRRLEIGLLPFEEKNLKFKRGQKICKEKRENKNHKQIRLFYWCG
jgi:hypothetical protein